MNTSDTNQGANKTSAGVNGKMVTMADSEFLLSMMAQSRGESAAKEPPGLSMAPTLTGLLQALRRRWVAALLLASAASALTVAAVFLVMPPMYMPSRAVRVSARSIDQNDTEFPIFKANMEYMVKSRRVVETALRSKLPDGREVASLDIVRSKGPAAADWLEGSLRTQYTPTSPEMLRVTLAVDNAEEGADLLNAVLAAFVKENDEPDNAKRQKWIAKLTRDKEVKSEELRKLLGTREAKLAEMGLPSTEQMNAERSLLSQKHSNAETFRRNNHDQIVKAKNEIDSLNARISKIDSLPMPESLLMEQYRKDAILTDFDKRLAEIDLLIEQYSSKYNEPYATQFAVPKRHEKMQIAQLKQKREAALQPELEKRWRAIYLSDLKNRRETVQEELRECEAREPAYRKEVDELERKIAESRNANRPPLILTYDTNIDLKLDDLKDINREIAKIANSPQGSRLTIEERGGIPVQKDISRQIKFAGVGGFGMFGLALFGVALLEFRSRKISSVEEVAQGLGLNVVGTIPALPARSRNNEAQQQLWQNQLHESVDAIRTVLLHSARNEPMRVVMVTSADSHEGKTTLATQLAASLARAWKRTLIIDGDLRHPATHKLFEVPKEPGLSEVLRGEVEVADAIRATPFSRLWILPAGNGDSHAIQALAQESVGSIFAALKQQYDFIIVDSPPVLPVTDSLLLGQHVDGILFSILRDVSRTPAVYAAQQKLAPLQVHTLGAVVLGTPPDYTNKNYRYVMLAK